MARKAKKIDIFEDKPLDIINLEEKGEVVRTLKNPLELTTAILKDNINMENTINDELSKNKAYKDAQSLKTPKSILKYQKSNNKKLQDEVNKEIKEYGVTLAKGQVLFHGGLASKKVGETIETTDTLSTTLIPEVARQNALHNGKAYKENELNINIIKLEDENIDGFVFNNRTNHSNEKEVLLEKDLELKVKKKTKIGDMEVCNGKSEYKTIPVYISEIEVSKVKSLKYDDSMKEALKEIEAKKILSSIQSGLDDIKNHRTRPINELWNELDD